MTHGLAQVAEEKIVTGTYAMGENEIMAPVYGKHDFHNMFSECVDQNHQTPDAEPEALNFQMHPERKS